MGAKVPIDRETALHGLKRTHDVLEAVEEADLTAVEDLEGSLCSTDKYNTWSSDCSPLAERQSKRISVDTLHSAPSDASVDSVYALSAHEPNLQCDSPAAVARTPADDGSQVGYQHLHPVVLCSQRKPVFVGTAADLQELIRNLSHSETSLGCDPCYLINHNRFHHPTLYLDDSMRCTTVSWMVEVAREYHLHQETLFLAVALQDRYLSSCKGVTRNHLQLISVASLMIAAKLEEELHPSAADFTSIADRSFTHQDLLRMERCILARLSFRINTPTAHTFLSLFVQSVPLPDKTISLASYLAELALLDYSFLQHLPSVLAAAALLVASYSENCCTLTIRRLEEASGYRLAKNLQLRKCVEDLAALQRAAWRCCSPWSPQGPVRDKFARPAWDCVACCGPITVLPPAADVQHS